MSGLRVKLPITTFAYTVVDFWIELETYARTPRAGLGELGIFF